MKRRNLLLLMTVLLLCSGCSAGYDESTAEPGEAVEGSPGNAQEQKKDGTAEEFCRKAQKKEAAELTLFSVLDEGKLIRYDMETRDGRINVVLNSLQWKDGVPQVFYTHEFEAHTWEYTDKGYLFVEEYQPAGYDGPPGRIGFRITPLDQRCRELNRKYVLPVGYTRNNLLITDWNEADYGGLDIYDLYEIQIGRAHV